MNKAKNETPFAIDTIAALSTPGGIGAISVVRLDGPLAEPITLQLFKPKHAVPFASHHARFGKFYDLNGEEIDQVVVTPFLKPHSYTGNNLIEISCHGNPLIAKRILSTLVDAGARLSKAGEFTERAFINGRIDLMQAESVLDLIQAKTTSQSKNALSLLQGTLGPKINSIRNQLLDLLTAITAGIDFPEEVADLPEPDIRKILQDSIDQLERLAATARSGKFLRQGVKIAIVGPPNAGKSSLLNQLLQYDRAIVSDVPGTTRDVLEELVDLQGLPAILLDTAGIRHSTDVVEQMGMDRTDKAIAEADLILMVVDATAGWQGTEETIASKIKENPWMLLLNKIDLLPNQNIEIGAKASHNNDNHIPVASLSISAKTGQGVPNISQEICLWAFGRNGPAFNSPSLNERQSSLCAQAVNDLKLAHQTVEKGLPLDCLATDLKAAIDHISEITGQQVSEEVITSVFANFCIGK